MGAQREETRGEFVCEEKIIALPRLIESIVQRHLVATRNRAGIPVI